MDMEKIGKFLSKLRHEKNLTQEQLGEEIGVTNKTVSRWETGAYLPPVEMLQILSEKYEVSINEILSGERLDEKKYREKAEENIKTTLEKSVFTLKDREKYFNKKWRKDHLFELICVPLILIFLIVFGILLAPESFLSVAAYVLCLFWPASVHNRKRAYIEKHLYDDKKKDEGCENEDMPD